MKKAFIIAAMTAALCSCSSTKTPCGDWRDVQRHDQKPFRVYDIKRHKKDSTATVKVRRYMVVRKVKFKCLPDTIQVGYYIYLPDKM